MQAVELELVKLTDVDQTSSLGMTTRDAYGSADLGFVWPDTNDELTRNFGKVVEREGVPTRRCQPVSCCLMIYLPPCLQVLWPFLVSLCLQK